MSEVVVQHAAGASWEKSKHPGVEYKSLRFDRDTGAGAVLLRMAPGTSYPVHRHTAGEDVYVLDGILIVGEERLGAGSYLYSPPGSVHAPRTEQGVTLLAVFPGRVEDL